MKKFIDAVIRNIWILVLALILALGGLTLLIGASFEEVATTSKGLSSKASSEEESSEPRFLRRRPGRFPERQRRVRRLGGLLQLLCGVQPRSPACLQALVPDLLGAVLRAGGILRVARALRDPFGNPLGARP